MITTEELRELSESTHPLHGDLVRICNAWLAEREAKPAPKWLPMSSPPMAAPYSSRVLVRLYHVNQSLAEQHIILAWLMDGKWHRDNAGNSFYGVEADGYILTGWMPLPSIEDLP